MWLRSAATPSIQPSEYASTTTGREGRRTRAATDIVQGELSNTGVELHQQRQRLANATGSTEDSDLGGLGGTETISAMRS